jgi:hypothetical protein
MNTNRKKILDCILIDSKKLHHFCLNKDWYINKNHTDILNLIYYETKFLPENTCLKERVFYIRNNYFDLQKCKFCNDKLKFGKTSSKLQKTCGKELCISKIKSENSKDKTPSKEALKKRSESMKKYWKENESRKEKVSNLHKGHKYMLGVKQSEEWIENRISKIRGKKKNFSKEEIKRRSEFSKNLHKDPEYKRKMNTLAARRKASKTMKEKILKGEFTPLSNNYKTHKRFKIDNYNFRSSWEAAFYISNPEFEYEKIRIKYSFKKSEHVYITDFWSEDKRILIEIKPKKYQLTEKFKHKMTAAQEWCNKNNATYLILDGDWFKCNIKLEKLKPYPDIFNKLSRHIKYGKA